MANRIGFTDTLTGKETVCGTWAKTTLAVIQLSVSHNDITTGEILCCDRGNHLKRSVALTKKVNKEMFGVAGQWRFCHDFGKKWIEKGAPTR